MNTRQIMLHVSNEFDVTIDEILSPRRAQRIALPRQVAMWMAVNTTRLSLTSIGNKFHKDHTTVMHAVKKIDRMMVLDRAFEARIERLKASIERLIPGQEDIVLEVPRRVILRPLSGNMFDVFERRFWTRIKASVA